MAPYLPEWKIYLWKKLLLNRPDPEAVLSVADFLYFDQAEYRKLATQHMQKVIDSIPGRMIFQNGAVIGVDNSMDTSSADHYYNINPQGILLSLIELAEQRDECLEITGIFLKKDIIDNYRNERKKYLFEHDKKRMASLTNPMGYGGWGSNPDNRFTDAFCGLSQSLYEKIENGQEVSLADLKEFASSIDALPMLSMASFKVNLNGKNMSAHVDDYIGEFITGDLVSAQGVRYFQFQHQKDNIFGTIKQIAVKFGAHNMVITAEEIAKYGGWEYKDEHHYRFYETLLALEKTGEIEIKSLRGAEIIISILDNQPKPTATVEVQDDPRERFNKDYDQFGIRKKEKEIEVEELARQIVKHQEQTKSLNLQVQAKKAEKEASDDSVGKQENSGKDPMTESGKDGIGYLILDGQRINIGGISSGKFKLAEILCNPQFGTRKTIETVYGNTQPKKGKNNLDGNLDLKRKFDLLESQIREINRSISAHATRMKLKNFNARIRLKPDDVKHPKSVCIEKRMGRYG